MNINSVKHHLYTCSDKGLGHDRLTALALGSANVCPRAMVTKERTLEDAHNQPSDATNPEQIRIKPITSRPVRKGPAVKLAVLVGCGIVSAQATERLGQCFRHFFQAWNLLFFHLG